MVPVKRLQKVLAPDRKKSIYIFILCHITKRGIYANSGHQADTAMFEAIACTLKTWTLNQADKVVAQSAQADTCQAVLGSTEQIGTGFGGDESPGHCMNS